MSERMVLCNMAVEMGAETAYLELGSKKSLSLLRFSRTRKLTLTPGLGGPSTQAKIHSGGSPGTIRQLNSSLVCGYKVLKIAPGRYPRDARTCGHVFCGQRSLLFF